MTIRRRAMSLRESGMFNIVLRDQIESNARATWYSRRMEIPKVLGPEPESLAEFTAKERKVPSSSAA
jgi:hypothetical protein